ncbi:tetratricopeptide repeat protein [Insolitispirillum peregrinum]|uniref:tetratricopeptide repeat protein n=1 Tax=Insolitispirillum peregrinum TaxID=80876 RepID=UPI00360AB17C
MRAATSTTDGLLVLGQLALDQQDGAQALDWFRSAARSGDGRALNMVGRCHHRGWGTVANPTQAAVYFRAAAERGDAWGMFNLADLLYRGEGVAQDDAQACHWYCEAARLGHAKALNMLGLLYEEGRGVPPSLPDAAACFQAAAEGGDCWGCFNIARLQLQAGNKGRAIRWFKEALSYGFPDFFRAMASALRAEQDGCLRALARRAEFLEHCAKSGNRFSQQQCGNTKD